MLQQFLKLTASKRKTIAIVIPAIIAWLLTVFSVLILKDYGIGVFVMLPAFIGFSSSVLYGYKQEKKFRQLVGVSGFSLSLYAIGLIGFALEGAICIIMAAPLGYCLTFIGTMIASFVINKYNNSPLPSIILFSIAISLTMGFETIRTGQPAAFSVTTAVDIDNTPEKVWEQVIDFSRIPDPDEWIFNAGIAYPTHAEIKYGNKDTVRYCNFSTGCFVEPVTNWQPPSLLQFDVEVTPQPLKEISPYNIEPAHLHGYFTSERGQFRLIPLPGNKTRLEGTTWYYHRIKPAFYWKLWSSYIIHKIHTRVLLHIKRKAEE